jgi:23S rRNA pseudouridine2605 synthase
MKAQQKRNDSVTKNSNQQAQRVRLNKFLAEAGIASRRKADELIASGAVKVNGKVVNELGTQIDVDKDIVQLQGNTVGRRSRFVYILLNKPKDCIATASDEKGRRTVLDIVRVKERIYPVGRLDRNTTGVLLLTNDGEVAHRLMHPRYKISKSYKATLDKPISEQDARKLGRGIMLEDGKTKPCDVYTFRGNLNEVVLIIHEGRNRQVRRMFEKLGYYVEKLDRVAYGDLTTGGLRRGEWRYLREREVEGLRKKVGMV